MRLLLVVTFAVGRLARDVPAHDEQHENQDACYRKLAHMGSPFRRAHAPSLASNRLVQANLLLKAAQSQGATAQADLQSKAAELALLENEREDLKRRLTVLPTLEKQTAEAKQKLAGATTDREFLSLEVRRLQVEKADLMRKLDDVSFLRMQLTRAEEDAELQRRLVKAGRSAPVDRKARLELLQDGTVRPVVPVSTQARK